MPGNLLFADKQFPTNAKDMKTILNYLYMLQEELRYTMGNLGTENFNTQELDALSQTIKTETGIASLIGVVDNQGATLTLLAGYTGQDGVVTVDVWSTSGKNTSLVYYANDTGKYYKYNGTTWVSCNNMAEASFTLAAINGQSTANISADRIGLTADTVVFATEAGLSAGTVEINGGCLAADTLETDALKVRTESNLDWLDFYAGIDMTVIDVEDTSYYPDTRQLKGVNSIRFYKDADLTSGHGDTGNYLAEVGALRINTTGISTLTDSWSNGMSLFLSDIYNPSAMEISSGSGVAIQSGVGSGITGPIVLTAYGVNSKTSGYVLKVTSTGIALIKYVSGTPTMLEQWS